MIALVGLGACLAGCVSDLGATATDAPGTHQMRYYGGPKYPMWPSQWDRSARRALWADAPCESWSLLPRAWCWQDVLSVLCKRTMLRAADAMTAWEHHGGSPTACPAITVRCGTTAGRDRRCGAAAFRI